MLGSSDTLHKMNLQTLFVETKLISYANLMSIEARRHNFSAAIQIYKKHIESGNIKMKMEILSHIFPNLQLQYHEALLRQGKGSIDTFISLSKLRITHSHSMEYDHNLEMDLQRSADILRTTKHFDAAIILGKKLEELTEDTLSMAAAYLEQYIVGDKESLPADFASNMIQVMQKHITEDITTSYTIIMGGGIIPGEPEDGNSYRAELGGLLGISVIVESLSNGASDSNASIIVACDNEKAIQKVGLEKYKLKRNMACIDLISEIEALWSTAAVKPKPIHVYGHLDEKKKNLTWIETLNVLMDKRAKTIAIDHFTNNRDTPDIQLSQGIGTIKVSDQLITSNIQRSMEQAITHSQVIQYLGNQLSTDPTALGQQTNWISIARARFPKKQSYARRKFLTKVISGDLPTGEIMKERKHKQSAQCPFCTEDEDLVHIFTCSSQKVSQKREELLLGLKRKMAQARTEPTLYSFLTKGIETWLLDPLHTSCHIPPALQNSNILQEIENTGWYGILIGLIPKSLTRHQHRYYQNKQLRYTGNGWTTKICIMMWDFLLQMWLHRNEQYHSEDIAFTRQGGEILDTALLAEHYKGIENLNTKLRPFFRKSRSAVLKMHQNQKLDWLRLLRIARERTNTSIIDEFSTDNSLRAWVGLPRVVPSRH